MPEPRREDLQVEREQLTRQIAELGARVDALEHALAHARQATESAPRAADAEQRLRQSEQRLRQIVDQLPAGAIYLDGEHIFLNREAEAITGYSRGELPTLDLWFRTVYPGRAEEVRAIYEADKRAGFPHPTTVTLVRKGGAARAVEFSGSRAGDSEVWLLRDVTEQREAESERQRLEMGMHEAQRLDSLGVLAGGVAHDFNNLLTGILGFTELTRLELSAGSPAHDHLNQIERASFRAADLCKQMLAYAGKGRFVVEPLDLSALVRASASLLQSSLTRRVTLGYDLAPDLPALSGDPTLLRQALVNLVINASEAIDRPDGAIKISTGRMTADVAYLAAARLGARASHGDYLYVEVRDDGPGMNGDVLQKIFDPFFTTKFTGRGLGLAAVLGIVRGHKGVVRVDSAPGCGSTFRLLFPIASAAATPTTPAHSAEPAWRGDGTLLVVDDEATVRTLAVRSLEGVGFHVLQAEDGLAALELLQQQASAVRLVLLDLTMPRLDGAATLQRIRQHWPKLPVIIMSGYSENELTQRLGGRGGESFLQKPYHRADLLERVRAMLTGGSPR